MFLRTVGCTLIFAGTAIGAGMLAIPLVTNHMGFWPAAFWLVVCYLVMLSTALMILEVNLAFPKAASFSTMASKTIGRFGQIITWISFCLLLYALAAAYITGGGSLLQTLIHTISPLHIKDAYAAVIFTVVLGAFVFAGTRAVDYANRVLMGCKLLAFFILVILLIPHVQVSLMKPMHFPASWFALPILITSFGSHVVIPSIRSYIGEDRTRLRWIVIAGCTLPLIVYLLWITVTLGVLPAHGVHSFDHVKAGAVGDLVQNLQGFLNLTSVKVFANAFTDIAITTSFLGVCLGLYDFMADGCRLPKKNMKNRSLVWLITFLPPLAFALFYPHGFVLALGYASIFVAILLIILPVWMLWSLRAEKGESRPTWALLIVLIGFIVVGLQLF